MRQRVVTTMLAGGLTTASLVTGLGAAVASPSASLQGTAARIARTQTADGQAVEPAYSRRELAAYRRQGKPWVTVSTRYARDWVFNSRPLGACIHVTVDGTATAQRQ